MIFDTIRSSTGRSISFELFPPKDEKQQHILEETIAAIAPLGPDFMSVTDRDGGTMRKKTAEVCRHVIEKAGVPAVAHLTGLGTDKNEMRDILDHFHESGIRAIMALRGDFLPGREIVGAGAFAHATDLIEAIRADGRFLIGCAAYPDGHPEAPSREADWEVLKDKFRAGADFAVTQIFFDNRSYSDLVDAVMGAFPAARILPGILPLTNWKTQKRFIDKCQASVPASLAGRLNLLEENPVTCRRIGIEYSIRQCEDLLETHQAPGIHIYSLNRSTAAAELVTVLRLNGRL
ncbi:MAG: methylenetetrahydrofolate reductase [Planctomycetes bacterium]|nr:methylenetetrahydrofolate reductase [Planctomycetota bacterium]